MGAADTGLVAVVRVAFVDLGAKEPDEARDLAPKLRGDPADECRHRGGSASDVRHDDGRRLLDATAPSSPTGVRILAQIPNLYGPGFTGRMTYYDTPAGAKVFAAGAFTLAGSVWEADVEPVVERLWTEMSTG